VPLDFCDRLRESLIPVPESSQFLIAAHNETLPVIAMCVSYPDCSTARIDG
jgi:hypothetical protein